MHPPVLLPIAAPSELASVVPDLSRYRNPVLPGFFPDPSVVRVGDDYYLVNSTFQYFPAITISHSRDLVNWRLIGHVFNRSEEMDLGSFFDGCGIWAPDISYHNGEYYVFFCLVQLSPDRAVNVRGNYMVKARSILGPYSKPVRLTEEGNDPSHFVDDDGTHYMLYAAGVPRGRGTKIVRLSDDCTRVTGGPWWMEFDPEKRAPEGPHVFKRDGYYYLTMAAGDGVYRGHHQLIARSRALLGPYELGPNNPFIVERHPDADYYHHGHAKLVTTPVGEWWALYLMRRRIDGRSPLGRETALDRVDWTEDGWPVLNGGEGPTEDARRPAVAFPTRPQPAKGEEHDDFSQVTLGPLWQFVRKPWPAGFSLTERPGFLRLRGSERGLAALDARNVVLQRERSHAVIAETRLEFSPRAGAEAGLVCYYDTRCHIALALADRNGPVILLRECRAGVDTTLATLVVSSRAGAAGVGLRVEVEGLRRRFLYRIGSAGWRVAGMVEDAGFLSDEGTPGWGFTGTMTGLYALRGEDERSLRADFDWFRLAWC